MLRLPNVERKRTHQILCKGVLVFSHINFKGFYAPILVLKSRARASYYETFTPTFINAGEVLVCSLFQRKQTVRL
jgi:hypothetical protein